MEAGGGEVEGGVGAGGCGGELGVPHEGGQLQQGR